MNSHTKKLSIAFYWHMHQPVYQLSTNGDYLMPWVRLHAVKDYLDMTLWAKKFDRLKLNFNFVPALIDSVVNYGENNAHDIHSRLTITPQEKLNDEDKIFILNNFFDANYQTMILPNNEYHRLYQIVQSAGNEDISVLTNQEYADLTALFNLAWIDPSFRTRNPELKRLIKKGKNYTLEDRITIIEIQREIIKKIIPTIKKLIEKNKVEITTSPYYHPILPILLDSKSTKKNQTEDEFFNLKMEQDAKLQTSMALDRIEEVFGKRPQGIWPSEQCVSGKTLDMLSNLGVKWAISDEGILANSINFEFEHDFKGYIKDPYHLLKTYQYKTKNSDIKMIFRESTIPNLIGFEYQNHNPLATANDLYDRIKVIQSQILSSPDKEHLLTIALDGENCWENYLEDGASFLKTLYTLITEDETLETVLISDYLDNCKESHKELNRIASGSWINRNFKLWIDEPVKDLAWTYLNRVKQDFSAFSKREPQNPNIELARNELFICEGSDWFWWYGEPNDSGRDNIFDFIFRTRLKNVYRYLDLDIPSFLDEPLSNLVTSRPSKYPKSLISPEINGLNVTSENDIWNNAGYIEIPDGPVLRESKLFDKIRFGNDENNFYLKFHLNKYIKENSDLIQRTYQMYIYLRKANHKQYLAPVRLINKTKNISPVSMEKFHNEIQIAIRKNKLQLIRLIKAIPGDMWVLEQSRTIETEYNEVLDIKIPFDTLEIKSGETLEFLFVNANYGIKDFYIPNEMVLSVTRPAMVIK